MKKSNVFWFKRDLRLRDNPALNAALKQPEQLLLVYVFEPSLLSDAHYDNRHWRFVAESLADMNDELQAHNAKILVVTAEVQSFFERLQNYLSIQKVFSTEETGLKITYDRDLGLQKFFDNAGIRWKEFQNNGVIRGRFSRKGWSSAWHRYMTAKIEIPDFENAILADLNVLSSLQGHMKDCITDLTSKPHHFQKGGRAEALQWMASFFEERLEFYNRYISKPQLSRYGCSRLSPYLAWGNLSIREVYHEVLYIKPKSLFKRQLNAFSSRLRWQSHFIQKFEMEPRMEFEAINKGFLTLSQPIVPDFVTAWKQGKTGYPLVDAAMRCVVETGYINFRMRAMVTSFLTHHLFQHFTMGSAWLARQFLDFEPGIHYGQFQMQAGFTGTNTVRVYNPTKNAHEHDAEAVFIKEYVPELAALPANLAIEPWEVTEMEAQFYDFRYGSDYPNRIVDIKETRKNAVTKLYALRKSKLARSERQRILNRHTIIRQTNE
ncbi:MAG: deoxyribodipyrimidine photo-lyase [Pricia sp.]